MVLSLDPVARKEQVDGEGEFLGGTACTYLSASLHNEKRQLTMPASSRIAA